MDCPWCEVTLLDDGPEAAGPVHARLEAHNVGNPVHTIERCDAVFTASILPTAWAPPKYIEGKIAHATHRARDIELRRREPLLEAIRVMRERAAIGPDQREIGKETSGPGGMPEAGVALIPLDLWQAFVEQCDVANQDDVRGRIAKLIHNAGKGGIGVVAWDPRERAAGERPRPIEIRAHGKVFARAAHVVPHSTKQSRVRIMAGMRHDAFELAPIADLEFLLDDVRFEVSLLAAQAWCEGSITFDVIHGDEQWHTCLVTRFSLVTRDGDVARTDMVECVAARMTRGTPVKDVYPTTPREQQRDYEGEVFPAAPPERGGSMLDSKHEDSLRNRVRREFDQVPIEDDEERR